MLHKFHLTLYKPEENNGAFARDNLANERTFLAWLRTAISFTSIGIAVTQFLRFQSGQNMSNFLLALTADDAATREAIEQLQVAVAAHQRETTGLQRYLDLIMQHDKRLTILATALGSWFIAAGVVALVLGGYRYVVSCKYLRLGQFPVSRWSIMLCFLVTLVVRDNNKTISLAVISLLTGSFFVVGCNEFLPGSDHRAVASAIILQTR
jgi:uncharacterized membrane protein YidH (DUF202 family)